MANEITEKSCLEAELLLGYKLFQQKETVQSRKEALQTEATALKAYETARERNLYNPTYQQSVYNAYWKYREAEIKKKQEAEKAKKETEARENVALYKRKLIVGAVVTFLVIAFIEGILSLIVIDNSMDWTTMLVPMLVFLILPLCVYIPIAISHLLTLRKLKNEKPTVPSYQTLANTVIDFPTYAKKYYGEAKLREEYDKGHADTLAKKKAIVEKANAQIGLCDQTLLALEGVYDSVVKKLTELPAFYFKPDAVEKMLFFYVNKRADNIRDLINLYETTVFQEAVLRSLKDIAVSVDRLAETVRGSFQRLGLQLGVLNESIRENTKFQRLSVEKLSAIQDENARHYMEVVDAIGEVEFISNTYVTTNVTTEVTVE